MFERITWTLIKLWNFLREQISIKHKVVKKSLEAINCVDSYAVSTEGHILLKHPSDGTNRTIVKARGPDSSTTEYVKVFDIFTALLDESFHNVNFLFILVF